MKSLTAVLEFAVRFMRGMHVRNCNEAPALKCNFFSNSIMKARASFVLIYGGIFVNFVMIQGEKLTANDKV